jgi:hypothetical protein
MVEERSSRINHTKIPHPMTTFFRLARISVKEFIYHLKPPIEKKPKKSWRNVRKGDHRK